MTTSLVHDALIYASDEEFLAHTVPFLREGIAEESGTVVATSARNAAALRDSLGADANEVLFVDSADVYASPISAVVAYNDVLKSFYDAGRKKVRAIGEVAYGPSQNWLRYEPIAHEVFANEPLHVICPYDSRILPPLLIEHAQRTHPRVQPPATVAFVPPHEMLASLQEVMTTEIPESAALSMRVGSDLPQMRRVIGRLLDRELPAPRAAEALVAINELVANGIRHGEAAVDVTVWVSRRSLICRVRNEGPAIPDPFAGYRPPGSLPTRGMGLWIARRLASESIIEHDASGPSVTLAFDR